MTDLPLLIGAAMQDKATATRCLYEESVSLEAEIRDDGWYVVLSAQHTMVELTALMAGLRAIGNEVEAVPQEDGSIALLPINPHAMAPSASVLMYCMEHGKQNPARLAIR